MVEVFHRAIGIDFRHIGAVAKGIRRKIDFQRLGRHAPHVLQIIARFANVAQKRFGGRHIFVRFHPSGGGHFPAAFPDALLDFPHHFRVVFFHNAVYAGLRLGEVEERVFPHQIQHGAERGQRRAHGFVPGPHPVHVDVRVRGAEDFIFLGGAGDGQKRVFRLHGRLAGNGALGLQRVFHNAQALIDQRVEFSLPLAGKLNGEQRLADDPPQISGRHGHMEKLFLGLAKGELKSRLFPVSTDALFDGFPAREQRLHGASPPN